MILRTWKTFPYPPFPKTFLSSKSWGPSLLHWPGFTLSSESCMVSDPSDLKYNLKKISICICLFTTFNTLLSDK